MSVKLIWTTPDAEKLVAYCARVSSPHQDKEEIEGLLKYCIKHGHWSVFEMANMCLEIVTTRDVSAQMIRHRSFSFQEFSQRYAEASVIQKTKPRRQDVKNRQNSMDDLGDVTKHWFADTERYLHVRILKAYHEALRLGIAKESARRLLPLATETKVYMNGSLRSWIHYFKLRCDGATQLEHREIAIEAREIFIEQFPTIGSLI